MLPLFILDPKLISSVGSPRFTYLAQSLRALDEPGTVLSQILKEHSATEVHVEDDFAPYGVARDAEVEAAGVKLIRTGSPYAVSPGRVRKSDGTN